MPSQENENIQIPSSMPADAGRSCVPRKRGREDSPIKRALPKSSALMYPAVISQPPYTSSTSSCMEHADPHPESETPALAWFDSLSKGCGFNRPRSDYWWTPVKLKEQLALHTGLRFAYFDPAPYPKPPSFDGLHHPWHHGESETIFVSPPFSDIPNWIAKMILEASRGTSIIALLPHQSDRAWYESILDAAKSIVFIRGKVNYINLLTGTSPRGGAPFPLFAVHFDNGSKEHIKGTITYTVIWPKRRDGLASSP